MLRQPRWLPEVAFSIAITAWTRLAIRERPLEVPTLPRSCSFYKRSIVLDLRNILVLQFCNCQDAYETTSIYAHAPFKKRITLATFNLTLLRTFHYEWNHGLSRLWSQHQRNERTLKYVSNIIIIPSVVYIPLKQHSMMTNLLTLSCEYNNIEQWSSRSCRKGILLL
jgi:hypothetical protein